MQWCTVVVTFTGSATNRRAMLFDLRFVDIQLIKMFELRWKPIVIIENNLKFYKFYNFLI